MNRTEQFDISMKSITKDRGDVYGHPLDDFYRVDLIKQAVAHCKDPEIRHALEMVGVKLCRIAETPDHIDSMIDIGGYARCMAMLLDERHKRTADKKKSMVVRGPERRGSKDYIKDWLGINKRKSIRRLVGDSKRIRQFLADNNSEKTVIPYSKNRNV